MKRILIGLAMFVSAISAMAEPTFQQVEGLIDQHQYASAEAGLEVIIANHPASAKAFYAMAQAEAGLGRLDKAQFALNKARGLDPELKFASANNIASLQQAITPQSAKIEPVHESHMFLILMCAILFASLIAAICYWIMRPVLNTVVVEHDVVDDGYGNVTPRSTYVQPVNTTTAASTYVPRSTYSTPIQPTVVNNYNSNSGNDLLTGVLVGEMIADSHRPVYVEREVIVEEPVFYEERTYAATVPAQITSNDTWDDTNRNTSPSWDSGSSSSSSDWSSSSSDSSSSWDSSSSSSSDW